MDLVVSSASPFSTVHLAISNLRAYRVLLTILVTVTSMEQNFSKPKQLKSYLPSTMTQLILTHLTTIALESRLFEKIEYEHIIEEFISRNTKRMNLFK